MIDVSVDDRRALWALTTRHLRSRTFAAVLLVRSALRARATRIALHTRGDRLRVVDDGADRAPELEAVLGVLRDPSVPALHALEARYGTDLLVALATSSAATVEAGRRVVTLRDGRPTAESSSSSSSWSVSLSRPRAWRKEERVELKAWLPGPRAALVVDGRPWPTSQRSLRLPDGVFFARGFSAEGGRGLVGFALDEATSKTTVLTRGLWVAQDAQRARGLPIVALYDDDDVAAVAAVARGRVAVERAAAALVRRLGEELPSLPEKQRKKVRSLLLRAPALPDAFVDVPLFDDERGAFAVSFADLRGRSRVVIGKENADVVVDADARAFLHRALPQTVKDALPPPRRRLGFALRQAFGFR